MRISDWSSDVCSSDLRRFRQRAVAGAEIVEAERHALILEAGDDRADQRRILEQRAFGDRKSVVLGKSVSVRVDLGGRRFSKKKKEKYKLDIPTHNIQ